MIGVNKLYRGGNHAMTQLVALVWIVVFGYLIFIWIHLIKKTSEHQLFALLMRKSNRSLSFRIALIGFCSAAILFSGVVAVSYIPRRISHEMVGIELYITGEDKFEVLQQVEIRIDGRLHNNGLFSRRPYFFGYFEVNGYEFTLGRELRIVFQPYVFGTYRGFSNVWLQYSRVRPQGGFDLEELGILHTNERFSSLVIHLREESTDIPWNRVVVAPTTDQCAAHKILREYGIIWTEWGIVHSVS